MGGQTVFTWGGNYFGGDLTTMLADNLATDAELNSGAATAFWTDEVGLKNRCQLVRRDKPTIIRHFDNRQFRRFTPGGDPDQMTKAVLGGVFGEQ